MGEKGEEKRGRENNDRQTKTQRETERGGERWGEVGREREQFTPVFLLEDY